MFMVNEHAVVESLHPGTHGNRLKDPQPSIRPSLGNPAEEREEGL